MKMKLLLLGFGCFLSSAQLLAATCPMPETLQKAQIQPGTGDCRATDNENLTWSFGTMSKEACGKLDLGSFIRVEMAPASMKDQYLGAVCFYTGKGAILLNRAESNGFTLVNKDQWTGSSIKTCSASIEKCAFKKEF